METKTKQNLPGRITAWAKALAGEASRWAADDPHQAAAARRVGLFFLAVLLCTLVARGTAAATMANVTVVSPEADTLQQKVYADGALRREGGILPEIPAGLTVSEVLVRQGQAIAAGDALARLDASAVDNELAAQRAALAQQKASLAALTAKAPADTSGVDSAKLSLQQAKDNYAAAEAAANATLAADNDAVKKAQDERNALTDDGTDAMKAEIQKADAALETAQNTLAADTNARTETLRGLQQQIDSCQLTLNQANATAAAGAAKDSLSAQADAASAQGVTLQIASTQKRIDALAAIQANGYQLLAGTDGSVEEVSLAAGQPTAAGAVVLSNNDSRWVLECTVSAEDAKKLTGTSSVHFSQNRGEGDAAILSVGTADASGNVLITAEPEGTGWKAGAVSASVLISQSSYEQTLPSGAIHEDNSGNFVYTIEQRTTVLGVSNVLVRTPVTVVSRSDTRAAVDGTFAYDAKVVATSTKALLPGERVRIES